MKIPWRWLPWSGERERRPECRQSHCRCQDRQGDKTERSLKNMLAKRKKNGTVREDETRHNTSTVKFSGL